MIDHPMISSNGNAPNSVSVFYFIFLFFFFIPEHFALLLQIQAQK